MISDVTCNARSTRGRYSEHGSWEGRLSMTWSNRFKVKLGKKFISTVAFILYRTTAALIFDECCLILVMLFLTKSFSSP